MTKKDMLPPPIDEVMVAFINGLRLYNIPAEYSVTEQARNELLDQGNPENAQTIGRLTKRMEMLKLTDQYRDDWMKVYRAMITVPEVKNATEGTDSADSA